MIEQATQIAKGHLNELLGRNKDFSEKRLKICEQCPLCKKDNKFLGWMCNSSIYMDIKTGETSPKYKIGYKNGCGCRLTAKTTLLNAKCPTG
jgi:hypothetical protein